MYFISKGSVKLVNEFGQSIYAFTEGTYFGEVETIEDVIFIVKQNIYIEKLGEENLILSSHRKLNLTPL